VTTETAEGAATLHERSRWVFEHLPAKTEAVLDVGCHDGSGLRAFASRARAGVGIDLDLPALQRGAADDGRMHLLGASADALPFRDSSFDCVIFSEVLEHVPASAEAQCIAELRRVMTSGGTLLFTTPHRGTFWWLDPLMAKTHLRRARARLVGRRVVLKGHKHYLVEEVHRLLDPHFDILRVERRACLLHPVAYWGHLAAERLGSTAPLMHFWQALMDVDYSREYGAAAYNVCVVARAR
jgi:ubiquinone/menaquinone biosynthesis C-methylase UbiE